jgi:serine/threonine-protein phosphatase 2A regulatory subunit A
MVGQGVEFFDDKLAGLCLAWLGDSVASVRAAATANLRKLAALYGPAWAATALVPRVLTMCSHPNYLYRMTTLFAMAVRTHTKRESE